MRRSVRTRGSVFVSRRRVLGGAGALAASAAMPRLFADAAGGVNVGMRAYTAIFPGGAGIHFDHAYYRDQHLTAMQRMYGDALTRVEMRKPLVAEGEPPSPYAAVVNFWIPIPRSLPMPVPRMARPWFRTKLTSPIANKRSRAKWYSARRASPQARCAPATGV